MGRTGTYRTIVVDPPWPYGAWGPASDVASSRRKFPGRQCFQSWALPYRALSVPAISALPVVSLAASDCELYLWTTQRYLGAAFGVLQTWGFRYCQTLVWCKTPRGSGQGGVYTPTTEFALLGRRGRMPAVRRVPTTWFNWTRTSRHSTKPEAFYDLVETVTVTPRLEMFARHHRLGWDVWGNEVESSVELALAR